MVASARGGALAIAAPVAASAAAPSKATPTTTTTTKPGKNAAAIAKLVIKPDSVGHVTVNTSGGSTFKPAKNGQSLHVGDTVQTDATGKAEIDYADTAYTRLDVDTTFTIKKLTDDQGNRQVEGSLDVGRTYNRTAALTQSQTFQQDGGGATAAVAGTAFVVTCSSATTCTFTAVIDNINLTGTGGQTKTLNPLDECVDTNGALCGTTTRLTPDELALLDWIQQNVYLDLAEHGIGDGVFQPFAGTVVHHERAGAVVHTRNPRPGIYADAKSAWSAPRADHRLEADLLRQRINVEHNDLISVCESECRAKRQPSSEHQHDRRCQRGGGLLFERKRSRRSKRSEPVFHLRQPWWPERRTLGERVDRGRAASRDQQPVSIVDTVHVHATGGDREHAVHVPRSGDHQHWEQRFAAGDSPRDDASGLPAE